MKNTDLPFKTTKRMTISQEPISLEVVLGTFVFEVPLYQREFSWELEQVSDLYHDIEISTDIEGHFLGSLLLSKKDEDDKIREVIDGQQRLTTLFLILYSIKKSLESSPDYSRALESMNNLLYQRRKSLLKADTSEEPRLSTGKRDKRLFRAILQGTETTPHKDGRVKSHKLLMSIHDFLSTQIEKLKSVKGMDGVVEFAEKVINTKFIQMLAEKKTDKILLFKTLNARGIELSQSDLIKNEVCNPSIRKNINEEEAIALWDDMRETLEKAKADIDVFLFHYINSLSDAPDLRKSIEERRGMKNEKDSYPPVPEKYIFDVYEEKLKGIPNTEDFLNDLKTSAEHYVEIYNPKPGKVYLSSLKVLNTNKSYPLLLRAKKILNDKNFEALCKSIECLSFRHSIMKIDPKDLEKFYYAALNKLKSNDDIDIVIKEVKEHATMSPSLDKKFKTDFEQAYPRTNISKMILSRISRHLHEGFDFETGDIWLEHIMPQTVKAGSSWEELKELDTELYDFTVDRIGNLTLLQKKLNIQASNKSFDKKKTDYYEKSAVKITKEILDYAAWDFDTIETRQEKLFEYVKEIWKLD